MDSAVAAALKRQPVSGHEVEVKALLQDAPVFAEIAQDGLWALCLQHDVEHFLFWKLHRLASVVAQRSSQI